MLKPRSTKSDSAKLLMITDANSDRNVSEMIAAMMLEIDRKPYWYTINHDIRPPKNMACPLYYDYALKDRVGIKTLVRERARKWIARAALLGYTVAREGGKPLTSSLEIARRRAANHQRPPLENDNDIPF